MNGNTIRVEEITHGFMSRFRFHQLNGSFDIRESGYGAYAIATGCGSGKTTGIKDMIRLRWYDGVLYSAFTKKEVDDMYQWIKSNLSLFVDKNGKHMTLDDVLVLHSGHNSEGVDLDMLNNNPKEIANKKVVLCTHHKLMNVPLEVLVAANFNTRFIGSQSPLYNALTGLGGSSYPRQWILIDENIEITGSNYIINKNSLVLLGAALDNIHYTMDNGVSKMVISDDPLSSTGDYAKFYKLLMISSISESNLAPININKDNLSLIKFNLFSHSLYYNYNNHLNKAIKDKSDSKVSFKFTDMIFPNMLTHLLLFDGTSDIVLKNSSKFKLLTYEDKYNSDVSLSVLPFNLVRRLKPDKSIPDYDFYIRIQLDKEIEKLSKIVSTNSKTLIFTWKSFKVDDTDINDELDDGVIVGLDPSKLSINKNFSIPEYVASKLSSKYGFIRDQDFSVEYYGSGRDKAINDYRDYDAIVLLGNYQVPVSVIDEFNVTYGTSITGVEYYLNRVIQAICRTRIRLHNGLPINVYMTSDWSTSVINATGKYLKVESYKGLIDCDNSSKVDYMYKRLINKGVGITPKRAEEIAKISTIDPCIFYSIMIDQIYKCSIELHDLYKVLPRSRCEIDKYNSLVNVLNNYGIELTITSN